MAGKHSIVYMYHFFFTHLSIDRYLGGFPVLAIINSATVKPSVHVSFGIMGFSRGMIGVGLLAHMAFLDIVF